MGCTEAGSALSRRLTILGVAVTLGLRAQPHPGPHLRTGLWGLGALIPDTCCRAGLLKPNPIGSPPLILPVIYPVRWGLSAAAVDPGGRGAGVCSPPCRGQGFGFPTAPEAHAPESSWGWGLRRPRAQPGLSPGSDPPPPGPAWLLPPAAGLGPGQALALASNACLAVNGSLMFFFSSFWMTSWGSVPRSGTPGWGSPRVQVAG